MPGLSGLELLSQAARIQPHATRILITAVMDIDTVIEAINRGDIFRFIVKPWLREEFLAAVKMASSATNWFVTTPTSNPRRSP